MSKSPPQDARRLPEMGWLDGETIALVLAAAMLGLGLVEQFSQAMGHDLGWLLLATGRLLDGADIHGRDLFEWNQPMVLYLLSPAVAASRFLDVGEWVTVRFYLGLLAGCSLWAFDRLARTLYGAESSRALRFVLPVLSGLFFLYPAESFGQREHLIAILILPQTLVLGARMSGRPVPSTWAVASGIAAGLAISIKPHFVLLMLGWEAMLMLRQRRLSSWLRTDSLAMAATGGAYLLSLVLFAPAYLGHVIPVALDTYWVYQARLAHIVETKDLLVMLGGALALWIMRRDEVVSSQGAVFFVTAVASYCAVLIQGTGWPYHFIPFHISIATLYAYLLISLFLDWKILGWRFSDRSFLNWRSDAVARPRFGGVGSRWSVALLIGALLITLVLATPNRVGETIRKGGAWRAGRTMGLVAVLEAAFEQHASGGAVWVVSPSLVNVFPAINHAGVEWTSRFSAFFLPAAIERFRRGDPLALERMSEERAQEIETFVRDAVVEDLRRRPPGLILIDVVKRKKVFAGVPFDLLDYLLQDPRFAEIWAGYRPVGRMGRFEAAVRRQPPSS